MNAAAQIGKSCILLLACLLCVEFRPGAGLFLLPNDQMAQRAMKKRLLPLLQCNEHYESYMPYGQVSYAESVPLIGCPIYFSGARTPAKVSSLSTSLLVLDECEKIVRGTATEADPISLAMERQKSYADSLVIMASTPTVPGTKFQQSFLEGSQSHYLMPCPHCGKEFEFKFDSESVTWDEGQPQTARIVCPHCHGHVDNEQRKEMMKKGHWVDLNPEARKLGRLSFHLNSLYSPFVSIADMAQKFVDALNSVNKSDELQNFTNSWAGEVFQQHAAKVYKDDVVKCISQTHHRGQLPLDYRMLAMGVDPGQNATHYSVVAICDGGKVVVVDWGTLMNLESVGDNIGVCSLFDSLVYKDNAGNEYRPDICLVDSGWATQAVYNECLRASFPGTVMPTKGSTATFSGTWARTKIRTMPDAPFDLLQYNQFQCKKGLYLDLIKGGKLVLPAEADDAYIQGFVGQELIRTPSNKLQWRDVAADHYGDTVMLSGVLLSYILESENNPLVQASFTT